jgi:hypothetical protein
MPSATAKFVAQRAEAMAIVALTRHGDLSVEPQEDVEDGFDLLVHLHQNGQRTGRMFGVEVTGSRSLPEDARVSTGGPDAPDRVHIPLPVGKKRRLDRYVHSDLPFPLCLFYFTMDDDAGYVRWLLAPDDDGPAGALRRVTDDTFVELTDDALATLLRTVHDWYDHKRRD